MTDEAMEIVDRFADKIGWSHRQAMREATASLTPPVHNGTPQPMVVNTGGGQPSFQFDYRAFGEALVSALTPTYNQQSKFVEQVERLMEKVETLIVQNTQLVEAVAGMEVHVTNNVPQAAVSVELPARQSKIMIEHEDGTKSTATVLES